MKVKYVKVIQENIQKFYLQVITDACVKIAAAQLCFEKKTKESVVENLQKMLCRILSINFWKKNISEDILWKINKKTFITFSRFWPLREWGWGEGVNPLKKEKFGTNVLQQQLFYFFHMEQQSTS